MVGGMPRLHRDEDSAPGGAQLAVGHERAFDGRTIVRRVDDPGLDRESRSAGSRSHELDPILGRDRARRRVATGLQHEVMRGRPIHVAVEEGTDDATAEHSLECLVMRLRAPLGDIGVTLQEAADAQAAGIGRAASETGILGRIALLQAQFAHARTVACPHGGAQERG